MSDIQPATLEDFDELKQLLNRANEFSIEQSGLRQWTAMEHVYAQLKAQIENGECYVLRNTNGEITSAIAISDHTTKWGPYSDDGHAIYTTKLMRDPYKSQPGEGRTMLAFAAQEAKRCGKTTLRCDTASNLVGLINYYLKFGFTDKGRFIYESTGREGILLEAKPDDVIMAINEV
jgi:ribosomal protein S18 acetylase RimI-like enzyme